MSNKNIVPFLLGGSIFSITLVVVSFAAGWVMTTSRAQAEVRLATSLAAIDLLAPICVDQFRQRGGEADLIALRALDQWKQRAYITDKGWATMPGTSSARDGIARACSERLLKITS